MSHSSALKFLILVFFVVFLEPSEVSGKRPVDWQRWMMNHHPRSLHPVARDGRVAMSGRQSGLTAAVLAGPALLAASSLLFSFPVLPMLFLAPIISNLIPDFNEISQEISNNPQLIELIQSVQNLSQSKLWC